MENYFRGFSVEHIHKSKNADVDELAKATARRVALPPDIFFQIAEDALVKRIDLEPRMVNVI
jgi:hypothetical protein